MTVFALMLAFTTDVLLSSDCAFYVFAFHVFAFYVYSLFTSSLFMSSLFTSSHFFVLFCLNMFLKDGSSSGVPRALLDNCARTVPKDNPVSPQHTDRFYRETSKRCRCGRERDDGVLVELQRHTRIHIYVVSALAARTACFLLVFCLFSAVRAASFRTVLRRVIIFATGYPYGESQ